LEGSRKISKVILMVVLAISVFLGFYAKEIKFDYDFEAFFPADDAETQFFEEHRHRFESDNDFIFIALRNEKGAFEQDFLEKVAGFVDSLSKDTLIRDVKCLTHMDEYIKAPFSPLPFKRPYITIDQPEKYASDSVRIFKLPELAGFFINDKADALLVNVQHREYLSKENCDRVKDHIDALLKHYELTDYKYAGRTIGMGYYIHKMQFETGLFMGLSFILVIIFLFLTFRSFWGVWVPLSIVTLSMLWIVGFMALVGQPINLILTVLPSIIFVVAMSDVIHLVSKYMDELRAGRKQLDAIKTAYREVGLATLMTSLTTAIGFISLLTVNMKPIRDFGIYTAIGVMLAFALAYTLLPALLILTKPPKIADQSILENRWYKILHGLFKFLVRNRKAVVGVSVVTLILSIGGTLLIERNYFLLEDLRKDSPLTKEYAYFDQEFMGLRPFELAVEVKDPTKNVFSPEVLHEMDEIEKYLVSDYGLKRTFSVVTLLEIANRSEHGGQFDYQVLPDSGDTRRFVEQLKTYDKDSTLFMFVDSTGRFGRISSTIGDIGLYAIQEKNDRLFRFIHENVDSNLIELHLTGTAHLLDRNMTSLARNLIWGLLVSVGIIGLIMGMLYRSVKMVIIALIVNILPLLMISAILGIAGVDLKVSTAVIFTISFGIAVDDTLHFISRFRQELGKGKSIVYAVKRTFLSTGRAIVLTSVILCAGFLLLIFSDFLGTFYVGFLISLTLLFALLCDLLLLPVLILLFFKERDRP
jgi:uncharacterized protein